MPDKFCGLNYGEIHRTVLKKEEQLRGRPIGKSLYIGAIFPNSKTKYVILARYDGKIQCYHFTEFVVDDRGLVIRDSSTCHLSELENKFADKLLRDHGL